MSENESKREVTGLILFFCAIALTLMYYLPESITGFVGEFFRNIGFGLLGSAAFLIPVYLVYAAIDFFIEKRPGVAKLRVRTVIVFMILFAALLAMCTMDFEFFRSLCYDADAAKIKASKAISLLWESGKDKTLIMTPNSDSVLFSGGLIGGGISVALYTVVNRAVSILALIVLLLSQVILVFHISLKKTAKKTAKVIGNAVKRPVQRRPMQPQQRRPVQAQRPKPQPMTPNGAVNKYVNTTGQIRSSSGEMNMVGDPFDNRMPIDRRSGFIDVSDNAFGVGERGSSDRLTYVNRTVTADYSNEEQTADFNYTAMPKNHKLHIRREGTKPSFLQEETKQDFYSLDGATYAGSEGSDEVLSEEQSYYGNNEIIDEEPYEIIDDESTMDEPYYYGVKEHQIRTPMIQPVAPIQRQDSSSQPISAEPDSLSEITINAQETSTGFSSTEGRIIETAEAPAPEITIADATVNSPASGKVISKRHKPYKAPSTRLLAQEPPRKNANNDGELKAKAIELEDALKSFGIETKVVNITHGPAITRYELQLMKAGTKVSRILSLQDDIALAMSAFSVRIEAPIPGTNRIGIELPNEKTSAVYLRNLIESKEFKEASPLTVPLGRDIPGKPIMCNLAKMPHLLIAGSTGSGKSVCINTILTSILYNSSYEDVKMILVDPKVVELSIYNGIPHLIMPVVTNPKKAANALKWAVTEMERRYKCFAESSVRDLAGYNEYLKYNGEKPLPLILIVIDELADLMTVAAKEVEDHISRLAAMARAAGLHMIIATQRPSVDVITGVIKSNVPSRIAFAVSSGVDSRTILDSYGAEKLLGKGDMLYAPLSAPKPVRGQGAFLSDKEVESVVKYLKDNFGPYYDEDIIKLVDNISEGGSGGGAGSASADSDGDELYEQAVETVIDAGNASVSILQRRLGVGYPRAARLIDVLEQKHIIGPFEGSKPRKVLINRTDWLEMKAKGNQ